MAGKLIRKVFFLNPERDAALLAWLAAQKNESAAIRAALEAYLNQPETPATASFDPALIRQAVAEALDLSAIRQVVEAALRSAWPGQPVVPAGEEAELEAALDDFNDSLVLG